MRSFTLLCPSHVVALAAADSTATREDLPADGNPSSPTAASNRSPPVLSVALALALSACGKDDAAAKPGAGGRGNSGPLPVVVEVVREQAWTDSLRALGTVHAREAVTVTAKVSETVQQVHFESGQDVARGAPLVTLSGQQQPASLASAALMALAIWEPTYS